MDNSIAGNSSAIYKEATKHLENILKLRTEIAGLDRNTQGNAYQAANAELAKEEDALSKVKDQALGLQNLLPDLMTGLANLEAEYATRTADSVKNALNKTRDDLTKEFQDIEKGYSDVLKNSPDLKNQLNTLRGKANNANDKTQLNVVNEQLTSLK
jgi:uncharacterized phage infection (PIP) family protein YhgE